MQFQTFAILNKIEMPFFFLKCATFFLQKMKAHVRKAAEESCWAMTPAAGESSSGRSDFVLFFISDFSWTVFCTRIFDQMCDPIQTFCAIFDWFLIFRNVTTALKCGSVCSHYNAMRTRRQLQVRSTTAQLSAVVPYCTNIKGNRWQVAWIVMIGVGYWQWLGVPCAFFCNYRGGVNICLA